MWEYPEHTQAKHDILGHYLDAWFPILSSTPGRILVLDGFAGRGVYNDGSPGSPIIALDRLLKHSHWPQMSHREFVFLFIEHDSDNVASLH
jgi:three-Cys-motif partner protein